MWLAILILAPIAIVLHGYYFSRRLRRAVCALFPRGARIARRVRIGYLVLTYSVPVLLLLWVGYIVIGRPEQTGPPVNWALDYLIVFPFWFVTVYSFQCTLLVAPIETAFWVLGRFRADVASRWLRRREWFTVIIAGVLLVYMPVRVAIDRGSLEVRRHDVIGRDLPAELDGFKIALIADLQADQYTTPSRLAQLVRATNDEHPDLVLIAGDIITRAPAHTEVAVKELAQLRAPRGAVSAIGDHDNFGYRDRERSVREIRDALASRGIAMKDNEVHPIVVHGRELAVIVATNNYITPISRDDARAVVAAAAGADFQIVLTHQTSKQLLSTAREAGVDLFLSGHTHGGQVRLWVYGLDLVSARRGNLNFGRQVEIRVANPVHFFT